MASNSFSSSKSPGVHPDVTGNLMRQVESLTRECNRLMRETRKEKKENFQNFSMDDFLELPDKVTSRKYQKGEEEIIPVARKPSEGLEFPSESFSHASGQNQLDSVPSYARRDRSDSYGARHGSDSVLKAEEEQDRDIFTETLLKGNHTDPLSEPRSKSRVTFSPTLEGELKNPGRRKGEFQDLGNVQFDREEEHPSEFFHSRGVRDPADHEYRRRRAENPANSLPSHTGLHEHGTRPKPLMLPEKFDGSQPWEDYLTHFKSVAEINGWNREQKARFLGANLKGGALEVYTEISSAARTSFSAVVEALERRFGRAHQKPLFLAQLSMRRRGRNESLQQLAQAIKRLVNGAYPSLNMNARDGIAVESFRAALDDVELQRAVFMAKPDSLAEAVTAAVEMESFQ
ncbi:Retroviral-like aspartic protease 1 [Holothuria leucospilota]|uniref:Retroviral-like aspartic protease 1 n=1 Tax=Holothuria leucospilota TaxID=206669 RepID=A0A9Q1BIB7_HOLLE|nr:Retroviral-like aspartic protease 1 [Holothuria leucospilota]